MGVWVAKDVIPGCFFFHTLEGAGMNDFDSISIGDLLVIFFQLKFLGLDP